MARSTSWMPLALGLVLIGAVVALSHYASDTVSDGLRGVAQRIPEPPDKNPAREDGADAVSERLPALDEAGDPDEPRIDLEYPTERDWRFLEDVMATGTPEARRSAAKALVVIGDMRGVAPLFEAARQSGPDGELYCLAALDVLRLQRWEDTLPTLLGVMLDDQSDVSQSCRSEVADRFAVSGGRDAERLAALSGHEDPRIRGFVASYLQDLDPETWRDVLNVLAEDPVAEVRARAGATEPAPATEQEAKP